MKKRLIALLCAAVLCLSMIPARAINVGDVYFTSVNDILRPLTMDTMPTWVNGALYVPAATFDSTVTGVDLGLYCSQSSTNNSVTLYTLKQMLVFDLSRGIAYDQHSGQTLAGRAINRNGRIYLPVEMVCNFFGLEDSYNYTQYGYLVRIKNDAAWLDDTAFIDAASLPMASSLQEFLRSQQPPIAPPVEPVTPQNPSKPPQTEEEEPKTQIQIYLAFRCETGEGLGQILNELDRRDSYGIFFFTPEQIVQQDDLVRRVVGSGHSIGVLAQGETTQDSRYMLAQANEKLNHVARIAATAALVPEGQRQELEAEDWVCWQENVDARPREQERSAAYTQRILRAIGTRSRRVYLTLDDSGDSARLLSGLLTGLLDAPDKKEYRVLLPIETRI